jgi:Ca2+-binding EF-hand superfamily protein
LWSAFKYFESSSESGVITADSVIDALNCNNLSINQNELRVFFDEIQKKGKKLNFEEFKLMVNGVKT